MAAPLRPDRRIGPYVLQRRLGRGGNGEVWQAQADDGLVVALKVLTRTRGDGLARFRREVDLQLGELAATQGLLPVLAASSPDGQQWLAMPVAEPVADALRDAGLDEVLTAVSVVAETLGRLHALGYAHRDIKPGNLYRWEGRWTVGDLGLIDLPEPSPLTAGRQALGPKWFLAPEMLVDSAAAAGGPADVYSLAKTLWGHLPTPWDAPPGHPGLEAVLLRAASASRVPRPFDRARHRLRAGRPPTTSRRSCGSSWKAKQCPSTTAARTWRRSATNCASPPKRPGEATRRAGNG